MSRATNLLLSLLVLLTALSACEPIVRNCPVIGRDPSSNVYDLSYDLLIPADCPVPLASPGTERKYAAGRVIDAGTLDFYYASVKVKNSSGSTVADGITVFFSGIAQLSEEYVAATGKKTFDDYDVAIFRAISRDATKSARGETKITYQQSSLATRLTGTRIPAANTSQTWSAPTSGGVPAYGYQWYRDGQPIGTGSSYTANVGSTDFDLRVEVTDQTWSTRAAVLDVDVDGVEASISGPGEVYASDGGGTWSASGQGGIGPYTYEWYVSDVLVGSGPSWSGYPGDGTNALQVRMRDSAGAFTSRYKMVRGIRDSDGETCTPPPGARTC